MCQTPGQLRKIFGSNTDCKILVANVCASTLEVTLRMRGRPVAQRCGPGRPTFRELPVEASAPEKAETPSNHTAPWRLRKNAGYKPLGCHAKVDKLEGNGDKSSIIQESTNLGSTRAPWVALEATEATNGTNKREPTSAGNQEMEPTNRTNTHGTRKQHQQAEPLISTP